jgi:uncharacterized protein YbjT (DUF2867 family)
MYVVTTPTGQIGSLVLAQLLAGNVPVRVVVRDPAKLPAAVRDRVEVVEGSHRDAGVVARAFDGAEAVFWLPPPSPRAARVEDAFVGFSAAACRALPGSGVRRVVGVSALGRGTPLARRAGHVTASLAMDDAFAATGVPYRALALPSFMDNLLRQTRRIREENRFLTMISPSLKSPTCAVRDIARAAVAQLRDASWTGFGEVPVLGPEDLSFDEMAGIMSEVLARPVRCERVAPDVFRARLVVAGMSEAMAQAQVEMALAKDAGLDNAVTRTPQTSSPTTFRTWCQEVLRPAVTAA